VFLYDILLHYSRILHISAVDTCIFGPRCSVTAYQGFIELDCSVLLTQMKELLGIKIQVPWIR
jgi:hypothetical protein